MQVSRACAVWGGEHADFPLHSRKVRGTIVNGRARVIPGKAGCASKIHLLPPELTCNDKWPSCHNTPVRARRHRWCRPGFGARIREVSGYGFRIRPEFGLQRKLDDFFVFCQDECYFLFLIEKNVDK